MTDRKNLEKVAKALQHIDFRQKYARLDYYDPFPKQQEFHDNGLLFSERCFSAGNQLGKTYAGASEVAMHLTGRYPDWWLGKRWDRPTRGWVAGVTGESTRDNPQRLLMGTMNAGLGTGAIPLDCLDPKDISMARGVSDLYDTVLVKHVSGGKSELKFKSYERGREKWQGDTLDFIWFDEEPPEDIYDEGLARLTTTRGIALLTFTPLLGMTAVAKRFFDAPASDTTHKLTVMTIEDSPLFTAEDITNLKNKYPRHQWACRLYGVPMQGEGAVFTNLRDEFECEPFEIPTYWSLLWGLDFGVAHPFAAVLLAWDKDTDIIYVVSTVRMQNAMVMQHCAAMKSAFQGHGNLIPAAWPQDGYQRKEFEGQLQPIVKMYKKHGQKMLGTHATFEDGSNSTEAGITEMQERLNTKRLRVFRHLSDWFTEYGRYHRKDGLLVKVDDDIMSATRVGIMAKRHARPLELLMGRIAPTGVRVPKLANGVDRDMWGG